MLFHTLSDNHKSSVLNLVRTTWQSDKLIPELSSNTGIIQRHLLDILIPVIKFFLHICLKELAIFEYNVTFVIDLWIENRDQLIFPFFIQTVKVDDVVLLYVPVSAASNKFAKFSYNDYFFSFLSIPDLSNYLSC